MNKKFIMLAPLSLMALCLVACGGGKSDPKTFNATLLSTEAIQLSNNKVTEKTDYKSDLTIKNEYKDYCKMPDKVNFVRIGGEVLQATDFTYHKDGDYKGSISIPANKATSNVEIDLTAKGDSVNINLTSNVYSLSSSIATIGQTYESYVQIKQGEEETYYYPRYSDFKISEGETDIKEYCKYDEKTHKLTIPSSLEIEGAKYYIIQKDINVSINPYQPEYNVIYLNQNEIEYEQITKSARRGEEFQFKASLKTGVEKTFNGEFEISVNGVKLARNNQYVVNGDQSGNYTVTINKGVVNGEIDIKGITVNGKEFIVYTENSHLYVKYGGSYIKSSTFVVKHTDPNDIEITFEAYPGEKAPDYGNVRILFGNDTDPEKWELVDKESSGSGSAYIKSSSEGSCVMVIKNSKLSTLTAGSAISIIAKANNVNLFNEYTEDESWSDLKRVCNMGIVPYLFSIGQESNSFKLGNDYYKARIIGMNRDKKYSTDTESKETASLTLELNKCYEVQTQFGNSASKNGFVHTMLEGQEHSDIFNFLNYDFLGLLPFADNLTPVTKNFMNGERGDDVDTSKKYHVTNTFNAYVFPLSLAEMNLDTSKVLYQSYKEEYTKDIPVSTETADNSAYEYYKNKDKSEYKKEHIAISDSRFDKWTGDDRYPTYVNYFTRCPTNYDFSEGDIVGDYAIKRKEDDGSRYVKAVDYKSVMYVSPAFCI